MSFCELQNYDSGRVLDLNSKVSGVIFLVLPVEHVNPASRPIAGRHSFTRVGMVNIHTS